MEIKKEKRPLVANREEVLALLKVEAQVKVTRRLKTKARKTTWRVANNSEQPGKKKPKALPHKGLDDLGNKLEAKRQYLSLSTSDRG